MNVEPVILAARAMWIDRLHHFLLSLAGHQHSETRQVSLHYHQLVIDSNESIRVCDKRTLRANWPFVCNLEMRWLVTDSDSKPLSMDAHFRIRVERLAQRYPELCLDVAMISALNIQSNRDDTQYTDAGRSSEVTRLRS